MFDPSPQNSFRANFKRKYEGGRDFNVCSKVFSYNALRERKLKPKNTFTFQRESYHFDPVKIREYDKKGRPILKFYLGNFEPIDETQNNPTIIKDKEGNQYTVIDGKSFRRTFDEGEMKSVIASSQKEPQKMDLTTLIIGIALGAMIGMVVMSFIYPSVFGHVTVLNH